MAFEIAEALEAPLDIFLVRKLGMPGHPEYAMGAIAAGGVRVLSEDVVRAYGIPQSMIDEIAKEEQKELERPEREYRRDAALETICARTPDLFSAVGLWHLDFSQTTEEEVGTLLREHATRQRAGAKRS